MTGNQTCDRHLWGETAEPSAHTVSVHSMYLYPVYVHRCVSGSEQLRWLNSRCDASFNTEVGELVPRPSALFSPHSNFLFFFFLPNIFYSFSTFVPFDIKCRFITKSSVPCCNCHDCRLQSHLKHQTSCCTCFFFLFFYMFYYTVNHHSVSDPLPES